MQFNPTLHKLSNGLGGTQAVRQELCNCDIGKDNRQKRCAETDFRCVRIFAWARCFNKQRIGIYDNHGAQFAPDGLDTRHDSAVPTAV